MWRTAGDSDGGAMRGGPSARHNAHLLHHQAGLVGAYLSRIRPCGALSPPKVCIVTIYSGGALLYGITGSWQGKAMTFIVVLCLFVPIIAWSSMVFLAYQSLLVDYLVEGLNRKP